MITDELRECIATAIWQYENDVKTAYIPKDKLLAIADRIDEQHRNALERVAAMVDEPDELDRLDKRIKALEHLTDGMLLEESELEGRIAVIERKLNHKKVDE